MPLPVMSLMLCSLLLCFELGHGLLFHIGGQPAWVKKKLRFFILQWAGVLILLSGIVFGYAIYAILEES